MLEILLIAGALALIPAVLAQLRGRNPLAWYIFGFFLFIVALPMVLILPPKNAKKCLACAEYVKKEAIKCRYCGADLEKRSAIRAEF